MNPDKRSSLIPADGELSRSRRFTRITGGLASRRLAALLVLIAGAGVPVWLAGISAQKPQSRDIHIVAYRYGFSPSRIHANCGDRLRLTFSTRDTGQGFFFQDYDLHVSITPGSKQVLVQRLSRPDDPPTLMETVEIAAGPPGWQGWLVSKSQYRNHTYIGPLHGTGRGDLIVTPNFLLYGSLGLLAAIPLSGWILAGRRRAGDSGRRINLFKRFAWLKRVVKVPSFQFNLTLRMLGLFWFIILAGPFGTKVSGRNAGPMIISALTQLEECLRLRPADPVPLGGFASDFFKTPKPSASVLRLRTLLISLADIPSAHFFLGQAADALGETGEAVAQYQAALKESPNNSAVHVKLGLISD
jgi:hypothetical protein